MKKLFFLSLALFFAFSLAYANESEKFIFKTQGDSLLFYNQTKKVSAIPMDSAIAIMQAGHGQYMVKKYIGPRPKCFFWLSEFSLVLADKIQQQTFIYANGQWKVGPLTFIYSQPGTNFVANIVFIYLPLISILLAGLIGYKRKKKLFFLYSVTLISLLLGIGVGFITKDDNAAFFMGGLAGLLGGGLMGIDKKTLMGIYKSELVGILTASLTGAFAGELASGFAGDSETIISYFIMVVIACLLSFVLAILRQMLASTIKESLAKET